MSDHLKQGPTEIGYPNTAHGQSVDQPSRQNEQASMPVSTERQIEHQNDGFRPSQPPPNPMAPQRTDSFGVQGPQTQRPPLDHTRSYVNQNQDNRDVRPPATARGPSNVQRPPPGSYPSDQNYPHDKSNGGFGHSFKNLLRGGEPSHGQRYEDDDFRKDSSSRKEGSSRKGNYSRSQHYKDERDQAEYERDEAERLLRELQKEMHVQKLEWTRALQAEQDTVKAIKVSALELQKTKDSKELVFGEQKIDDVVRERFESLLNDIRTWASGFACNAGQELHFEESLLSEYQQVAPSCATLNKLHAVVKSEKSKQDKKQKRHFIRGWTSYVMIKFLFRILDEQGTNGHDVGLSEDVSNAFERLEQILWHAGANVIPRRSFNDWRALSVHLLYEATEHPSRDELLKTQSENAVQKVMSLIHVWADAKKESELTARLVRIFQDALVFSQLLRQQRALWTVRLSTMVPRIGPLMFDAGCMKDDNLSDDEDDGRAGGVQSRQKYVSMIISPALYKRGTMAGAKFDSERAVVPATVIVSTF